jgi:hypothetical protein
VASSGDYVQLSDGRTVRKDRITRNAEGNFILQDFQGNEVVTPASSATLIDSTSHHTFPNGRGAATKRYGSVTENVTRAVIEEWVRETTSWFDYAQLDRDLGITTPDGKRNRRVVLHRLREEGIIEPHGTREGLFRRVTADVRLIDFKAAGKRAPLDIGWPFDIQKLVNIYPGNVIVLAGEPNAGKTAFLLNVIRLNMNLFPVYYFSSEMGGPELSIRLGKFPGIEVEDWNFQAAERANDFQDVIVPDAVNIIDYFEFPTGQYFMIAESLRAIWTKLGTGVAIVAIQKGRGSELGRGSTFGLEKPRLYLSMGRNELMIVKGKNWADRNRNPNGLVSEFKLTDGCNFMVTKDWYRPQE